ncbi:hypothetical protein AVEN_257556-1, partial [Araneus ventricosus]
MNVLISILFQQRARVITNEDLLGDESSSLCPRIAQPRNIAVAARSGLCPGRAFSSYVMNVLISILFQQRARVITNEDLLGDESSSLCPRIAQPRNIAVAARSGEHTVET